MKTIEAHVGDTITGVSASAIELRDSSGEQVQFDFNGVIITTTDESTAEILCEAYSVGMDKQCEESRKKREAYLKTPEGIAEVKEAERKAAILRGKQAHLNGLKKDGIYPFCIAEGKLSDFGAGLAKNRDAYGLACYTFATAWACLMELEIGKGNTVQQCAKDTSHTADLEGITRFMYGAAVSILSHCWEHGEELRKWHNLDTQIGTEGEEANESGEVLNPALMSIGKK